MSYCRYLGLWDVQVNNMCMCSVCTNMFLCDHNPRAEVSRKTWAYKWRWSYFIFYGFYKIESTTKQLAFNHAYYTDASKIGFRITRNQSKMTAAAGFIMMVKVPHKHFKSKHNINMAIFFYNVITIYKSLRRTMPVGSTAFIPVIIYHWTWFRWRCETVNKKNPD